MSQKNLLKVVATGAIIFASVGGPGSIELAQASQVERGVNPQQASQAAARAERLLAKGKFAEALRWAETAVKIAPSNAGYRSLLGHAYLNAGRFRSAEQSFLDADSLGSTESRTVVGHALALIANGNADAAVRLLDANQTTLPATDYGLGLALAGDTDRGILVLNDVAQASDATARDRQNLALSYALGGHWLQAKLIAAQDLTPTAVNQRMMEWAQMAQVGQSAGRIAVMLGVDPVSNDAGVPAALALNGGSTRVATAQYDPAPISEYAPKPGDTAPVAATTAPASPLAEAAATVNDGAAPEAAPAATTPVVASVAIEPARPVTSSDPLLVEAPTTVAPVIAAETQPMRAAPASAADARAAAAARVAAMSSLASNRNSWAVQIGAYYSVRGAQRGWTYAQRAHPFLANRRAISTSLTLRGRTYYRLAATGFVSANDANRACAIVRQSGGTCFVRRHIAADTVRWAYNPNVRQTTRIATR